MLASGDAAMAAGRRVRSFMSKSQSTVSPPIPPRLRQWMHDLGGLDAAGTARGVLLALALIAATTAVLLGAASALALSDATIIYLIPVLVAAIRWGVVAGIVASLASVAAAAFFFYAPIYSLQVSDPQQVVDMILFLVVAVVASQLAANVRHREDRLRTLYSFSRRLAVASGPADIYAAIQDHLTSILGRRVILFEATPERRRPELRDGDAQIPGVVREAIGASLQAGGGTVVDRSTGVRWLLRPVAPKTPSFGMVAIELGPVSADAEAIRQGVDAVLADAAATLERLDVAAALGEAKMRVEAETFRDALIGSVSHELRTPLASLVGSAYVLANAPGVAGNPRLAALAEDLREEAGRLNNEIQNLLDASRITSAGVRANLQWSDVVDIVNAAVERQHRLLSSHRIAVEIPGELPLVHTDPVMIEQSLGQIIGNAAKYSPAGSLIRIAAADRDGAVVVSVADQGAGLTDEERTRIWERFYRSPRHHPAIAGSGLGLWIARAFVVAAGGSIEATSPGSGKGTAVTIHLPAPAPAEEAGQPDE
jgi:two-component system sensor histidine kinase KdpD